MPGGSNNSHRLIRRGLPYGPTYDRTQPYDGLERGMLFQFINSNIENQYEFLLRQWANHSEFAGAVRLHPKSKDPLTGTQDPAESIFVIPRAGGVPPIEVTGLSSFVTTKAAAYVFLASVTAIKFIAKPGRRPVIRSRTHPQGAIDHQANYTPRSHPAVACERGAPGDDASIDVLVPLDRWDTKVTEPRTSQPNEVERRHAQLGNERIGRSSGKVPLTARLLLADWLNISA